MAIKISADRGKGNRIMSKKVFDIVFSVLSETLDGVEDTHDIIEVVKFIPGNNYLNEVSFLLFLREPDVDGDRGSKLKETSFTIIINDDEQESRKDL